MADNSRVDPQEINSVSPLRASDADRDQAASVINNAMAEGRLTAVEHSERLDAIYAAKTQAELVPLLADLPGRGTVAAPAPATPPVRTTGIPERHGGPMVAILGSVSRKGIWRADPVMDVVTVLGGADLDFRDAELPGGEMTLRAVCVLGGVTVIVPPEMHVTDLGVAILGGRETPGDSPESARPGAPVLRITGVSILGGVEVQRMPRKQFTEQNGPAPLEQ
jgi:hypothetical protein